MRRYLKFFAGLVLIPLTQWYLRKPRNYSFDGISINVLPTVFHPGFFGSTKFLLRYLKAQNLKGKNFLELGCGTGLISVFAAQQGARVIASDLNPIAVQNAASNATLNNVSIDTVQSDLFTNISQQNFDWIVINPPYYPKKVEKESELAWYCGEDFKYYKQLFSQLPGYQNSTSRIIMVLSEACDINAIRKIAKQFSFEFESIAEESAFFERRNYIFSIK